MKYKFLLICLLLPCILFAGDYKTSWNRTLMDGSRTGVTIPMLDNIDEALGTVNGKTYNAPNGRVYKGGSIVKIAKTVIDAQEIMAPVKEVIATSAEAMESRSPESALSNWYADLMMAATEEISGRKVDLFIGNFGGIRVPMPKGDVTVDDIQSMFPFRNDVVYVSLKGSEIRRILTEMARRHFEVLGGVRVVSKNRELVSVEIGGEPLDDDKTYGLATISFLLTGGDGLYLDKNALEVIDTDVDIYTAVRMMIQKETDAGRPLHGEKDGRVTILRD